MDELTLKSLPVSGPIVARFGTGRTTASAAVLFAAGLATVAIGSLVGVAPVVAGLVVIGAAMAAWDVAMNVHGTALEHRLSRSVLPRFHAGFSVGSVAGALIGTAMVALDVPVAAHLTAVALVVAVALPFVARRFIADDEPSHGHDPAGDFRPPGEDRIRDLPPSGDGSRDVPPSGDGKPDVPPRADQPDDFAPGPVVTTEGSPSEWGRPREQSGTTRPGQVRGVMASWRERRTLLIGVFVLAFTFAEGAGTDWIGVAAIDGHGAGAPVATLAFAAFLAAMTLGRWFGPPLIDRYGRVPVVRALTLTRCAGAALFVFAPAVPLAIAGAVLWGIGNALGFPVGMSAAGDDPAAAAGRVSVISTIGYTGFLAGAPALGLLGQHVTVLRALISVAALLGLAALSAAVIRKPGRDQRP